MTWRSGSSTGPRRSTNDPGPARRCSASPRSCQGGTSTSETSRGRNASSTPTRTKGDMAARILNRRELLEQTHPAGDPLADRRMLGPAAGHLVRHRAEGEREPGVRAVRAGAAGRAHGAVPGVLHGGLTPGRLPANKPATGGAVSGAPAGRPSAVRNPSCVPPSVPCRDGGPTSSWFRGPDATRPG